MFLRIDTSEGPRGGRRLIVIACDVCGKERSVAYCVTTLNRYQQRTSFCSSTCQNESQKNGKLRDQLNVYFVEKYGVKTPLLTEKAIQAKNLVIKNTYQKSRQTLLERYGVDNPMRINDVAQKQQDAIRSSRNGLHHFETDESLEKRRRTCIERYGHDHPMKVPSIVTSFPFKEVWRKSHLKKKENGTYIQSASERTFGAWLIMLFGKKNVSKGVNVNDWSIDFECEVEGFKFWIQYDGVYWHGLDAPSEVIQARQGPRAHRIANVVRRDEQQNQWFVKQGLLLLRVTDKEFERFIKCQRRKKRMNKQVSSK
jgi:hypothetical protein